VEPDLLEWNYGDYEGLKSVEIAAKNPGWNLFRHGAPGGESPAQVIERVDRLVERLKGMTGNVLCFAHGHILRVLAARWLGLPPAGGRYFALGTGSVSRLGFERQTRVITRWNLSPSA